MPSLVGLVLLIDIKVVPILRCRPCAELVLSWLSINVAPIPSRALPASYLVSFILPSPSIESWCLHLQVIEPCLVCMYIFTCYHAFPRTHICYTVTFTRPQE